MILAPSPDYRCGRRLVKEPVARVSRNPDPWGASPQFGQAVPEDLDPVEHGHAGADERRFAELRGVVAGPEFVPGVLPVLILDPVMPGEEGQRQVG